MTDDTHIGAGDRVTTGTRLVVDGHGGRVVADAYRADEQPYPESGREGDDPWR